MLSNDVKRIIEQADSDEEAAYLICCWIATKPGVDAAVLFRGDTFIQHLLADASEEMQQRVESFGLS
jgi:hypothetical protein